ncbi:hypothetical protein FB45DRAFT_963143 [Roridomyces roridus]|uniref:F-box domain-containing protein n=1 Tax=Roridomyces roridus TaxID=1738132 RepID=A0AAD7F5S7_9AGAR|nr:hypothetical protein FB45DRAFT_963143 [Roridomyces roridus]
MSTFEDFPPELTLQIFPHLPLKGLVAAEGVCRQWKQFVAITDIYPPRRALFELYQKIVRDPLFRDLDTRPWLWDNLRSFDRQAYVDHILAQHDYIPEDFRLWILEWPNKAVIACAWPGLPEAYCAEEADNIERRNGYNHLGCHKPQLRKIILDLNLIMPPDVRSDGVEADYGAEYVTEADDNVEGNVEEQEVVDFRGDGDEPAPDEISDHLRMQGYYCRLDVFDYSPPAGSGPMEWELPALLIWEIADGGRAFLALSPDSPFSVYWLLSDMGATYVGGDSRQYHTWISWLESNLQSMHRAADGKSPPPHCFIKRDSDGNIISYDTWYRSRPACIPLWTEEDEANYKIAHGSI